MHKRSPCRNGGVESGLELNFAFRWCPGKVVAAGREGVFRQRHELVEDVQVFGSFGLSSVVMIAKGRPLATSRQTPAATRFRHFLDCVKRLPQPYDRCASAAGCSGRETPSVAARPCRWSA